MSLKVRCPKELKLNPFRNIESPEKSKEIAKY